MKLIRLLFGLLVSASAGMAAVSQADPPPQYAEAVANEAVAMAAALPPGYHRDLVLRAVSRNLRWFG